MRYLLYGEISPWDSYVFTFSNKNQALNVGYERLKEGYSAFLEDKVTNTVIKLTLSK